METKSGKELADDADKFMIQGQFTDVISDGQTKKTNRAND